MNDETSTFDWSAGGLDEAWWRQAMADIGATEAQGRFAACIHAGFSRTAAARLAGYAGNQDVIRQQGSRVYKTGVVQRLLALANAEKQGPSDKDLSPAERRRELNKLARSGDQNGKLRAIDMLNKMDEQDRTAETVKQTEPRDPRAIFDDIGSFSPEIAAQLAAQLNIKWTPPEEYRARADRHLNQLAEGWIRTNAARAAELANFWLRSEPHHVRGSGHDGATGAAA